MIIDFFFHSESFNNVAKQIEIGYRNDMPKTLFGRFLPSTLASRLSSAQTDAFRIAKCVIVELCDIK